MVDQELDAMSAIRDALDPLQDRPEVLDRVLKWTVDRFANRRVVIGPKGGLSDRTEPATVEIPGIGALTEGGVLKITARDLKATSTIDAAVRLAHIAIFAHEKLTGESQVSSRKVIVPLLKEWRVYDGNTRSALARHRGIIRQGDLLTLDAHSRKDAERFVEEILDDQVSGRWNPAKAKRRRLDA